MKKRLILGMAALAAVTFTSCQKDQVINQVPQEQAIEFNTYLGRDAQTKGIITTTESIQTSGFGVYAYYTGEDTYATKYAASSSTAPATVFNPNFMSNQKVTYTSPNWVYNPIKYWPNTSNHKVSFIAYAPHYALNDATVALSLDSEKGTPKITYNIPESQTNHVDLVVAPLKNDLTKENGSVSLRFFHALSRIGFKVKSDVDYSPNAKITLKSITLSGPFYKKGVLELYKPSGDVNHQVPSTNAFWVLDNGDKTSRPYTVTKDVVVTNALQSVSEPDSNKENESNYIMVIPQTFSGTPDTDKISITVVYDVEYDIVEDSGNMDGKITNTVTKTTPVTFAPGKAYTFNLSIGMTGVTFSDIVVDSWPEPGSTNVGSF